MKTMDINKLTLEEASEKIKKREITSQKLALSCFSAINDKINAFISKPDKKKVIEQSEQSDQRLQKGKPRSILEGIPIAIKDNILVKDERTTAGSKILEDFISPYDATVIKKLKEAGAILFGKTNMDEFACGSSTETSYFGSTLNPIDKSRVPGGSSGGSAAAVANHEVIAALGSDTGGSIRQPASFCGIVGLKPTYGRVSRFGLLAMASSLDQIGTLTKTVFDAALLLKKIEGGDDLDSTSVNKEPINLRNIKKPNKNIKMAVLKESFAQGIDKEVATAIKESIEKGKNYGFSIKEVSFPIIEYALAVYYIIMPAELSSNLARYDGIKYGYSIAKNPKQKAESLLDVYLTSRAEGFGPEIKRRIMLGTYVLSSGYYEAYYLQAQKVRALIKKGFDQIFKSYDLILTPTSPTTAFKLGEKIDDPLKMYLSDVYTVPVNIAGLPAISLPCGRDKKGLPIGLQIIAPAWQEEKLLNAAYQWEKILNYKSSVIP